MPVLVRVRRWGQEERGHCTNHIVCAEDRDAMCERGELYSEHFSWWDSVQRGTDEGGEVLDGEGREAEYMYGGCRIGYCC